MSDHPKWCNLPEDQRPCFDLRHGVVDGYEYCNLVCPYCNDDPGDEWRAEQKEASTSDTDLPLVVEWLVVVVAVIVFVGVILWRVLQ
jgi:hypothetical protein